SIDSSRKRSRRRGCVAGAGRPERYAPPSAARTGAPSAPERASALKSPIQHRISRSALTLRASVPNLDQPTFARLAKDAEQNCPVSKVLKAEIALDAASTWRAGAGELRWSAARRVGLRPEPRRTKS